MAVILLILKIIGFVILAILALILLMMLLVLLSPICYNIAGSDTEGINGKFDVKWILGAIHAYGAYYKQDLQFSLRLFGYCIYGTDKKQKKNKNVTLSVRSKQEQKTEQPKEQEQQQEQQQKQQEQIEQQIKQQELEKELKQQQQEKETEKVYESVKKEKKISKNKTKKQKKQKTNRIKKQKKKKEKKEKKAIDFNYFLHMENKKELIKAVTTFCKRMLKGVLPKHCHVKATIGTGDPALTGYILGIAGVAKMKFSKLQITGDFTQKVLKDVFLEIKGRIIVGYLLYAVLRLVFVKPVQKIIIAVWKGYGDKNGQGI